MTEIVGSAMGQDKIIINLALIMLVVFMRRFVVFQYNIPLQYNTLFEIASVHNKRVLINIL